MRKISLILSFLSLLGTNLIAQTATDSYSLDQCIQYAFSNQTDIKNAELNQQIAEYKVKEVFGIGLPQINGEASTMYNVQLKPMFLTNEMAAGFLPPGTVPAGANPKDVMAIPNLFQLKGMNDVSLSASQILFSGSYLIGLQASKVYTDLTTKAVTQSKIQTAEKITKAYYLVLINNYRLDLLENNIARLDTMMDQMREMNKAGFVETIDVSRLEVAYNNLLTEKTNVENLMAVSNLLLKYQMGYPIDKDITLTGDIKDLESKVQTTQFESIQNFDYNKRVEYSLLETQQRLQTLNFKNTRAASYPTLVAFGTAGLVTSHNDYLKMYTSKYYGYGYVGAKLTLPIFSGLTRYSQQQQAKLEVLKVENQKLQLQDAIDLQIMQTQIVLKNNLKSMESQRRNLDLAQEVIRVTKAKYEAGVGSNLEVIDAENTFKEAQTNYFNNIYNALVALIDYQIATGTLYNE
ncbi:MAG: TolC family protein [Cytophagaceae bacterium]